MSAIDWQDIATRTMHPIQVAILEYLADHDQASPVVIARALDAPLGNVSYHMRALLKARMVAKTRTRPRRGAVEHFYRLNLNGGRR